MRVFIRGPWGVSVHFDVEPSDQLISLHSRVVEEFKISDDPTMYRWIHQGKTLDLSGERTFADHSLPDPAVIIIVARMVAGITSKKVLVTVDVRISGFARSVNRELQKEFTFATSATAVKEWIFEELSLFDEGDDNGWMLEVVFDDDGSPLENRSLILQPRVFPTINDDQIHIPLALTGFVFSD